MILRCSGGMYVTYTSKISLILAEKKAGFRQAMSGTFLAEMGLFLPFCAGLLTIALGSKPPSLARIAGIGLLTRLDLEYCHSSWMGATILDKTS